MHLCRNVPLIATCCFQHLAATCRHLSHSSRPHHMKNSQRLLVYDQTAWSPEKTAAISAASATCILRLRHWKTKSTYFLEFFFLFFNAWDIFNSFLLAARRKESFSSLPSHSLWVIHHVVPLLHLEVRQYFFSHTCFNCALYIMFFGTSKISSSLILLYQRVHIFFIANELTFIHRRTDI